MMLGKKKSEPEKQMRQVSFLRNEAITGVVKIQAPNGDGEPLDAINALICAAVDIAVNSDMETKRRTAEWLGGVTERLGQEVGR